MNVLHFDGIPSCAGDLVATFHKDHDHDNKGSSHHLLYAMCLAHLSFTTHRQPPHARRVLSTPSLRCHCCILLHCQERGTFSTLNFCKVGQRLSEKSGGVASAERLDLFPLDHQQVHTGLNIA